MPSACSDWAASANSCIFMVRAFSPATCNEGEGQNLPTLRCVLARKYPPLTDRLPFSEDFVRQGRRDAVGDRKRAGRLGYSSGRSGLWG